MAVELARTVQGCGLSGMVRFARMAELLRSGFEARGSEGGLGSRRVRGVGLAAKGAWFAQEESKIVE